LAWVKQALATPEASANSHTNKTTNAVLRLVRELKRGFMVENVTVDSLYLGLEMMGLIYVKRSSGNRGFQLTEPVVGE
jgi:hypothetical protein